MLHRFADPAHGIEGRDPASVRRVLEYLRRERDQIVLLGELFERLAGHGPPADRTVCFTQDDGTLDQATIAAPLFAEYDAPVTRFVVTDYLDGKLWLWWDQVEHLFEHTQRRSAEVSLGGKALRFTWENTAEKARAQEDFTQRCKRVPDPEKHAGIARLAAALEVPLPESSQRYAPMTWDQLRACEARGMSFGSHTVTHPLFMTDDAQSERELTVAWQRVCAEAKSPVPIFCYPNGLPEDFGPREVATLTRLGFRGAVTALPQRYARVSEFPRRRRLAVFGAAPRFFRAAPVRGAKRVGSARRERGAARRRPSGARARCRLSWGEVARASRRRGAAAIHFGAMTAAATTPLRSFAEYLALEATSSTKHEHVAGRDPGHGRGDRRTLVPVHGASAGSSETPSPAGPATSSPPTCACAPPPSPRTPTLAWSAVPSRRIRRTRTR